MENPDDCGLLDAGVRKREAGTDEWTVQRLREALAGNPAAACFSRGLTVIALWQEFSSSQKLKSYHRNPSAPLLLLGAICPLISN
jgi:hypothetical protein